MKNHGKKMFPGVNKSNIFFLDNQKSKKKFDKFVNKNNNINNTEKKTSNYKKINTNNSEMKSNNKLPMKKRVLKKFNSTTLKKSDISPFSNENNIVKKRQLITHKSMDYLNTKKDSISLTEPNSSLTMTSKKTNNKLKSIDLNKIKLIKHRKLGSNNRLNISFNSNKSKSKEQKRNSISTFSSFTQRKNPKKQSYNDISSKSNIIQSKNFYKKFVNKNNNNKEKEITKKKRYIMPKEETYIIKKEKLDNHIIDINSLKKNLITSGINIISLTGLSSSLVPINNDSVKLILNANEVKSEQLYKIQKILKNEGLKLNEMKNNYNKKFSKGIFPAKSRWNDGKYGGRENLEKMELSKEFKKKNDENKFHKKNILSKNNFVDYKYKNNIIKRNKSVE